ncbi:MAG: PspC domain-containing protein [Hyphomonadaceae bacterium]
MERVVTINLAGNAYQLDESAYNALRSYMDQAERALNDNPDRAEILRDLEQAIADKCTSTLTPHRTVVSLAAMQRALEQMGPVEGAQDANASQAEPRPHEGAAPPPRRLYRIYDKHAWSGVSAGMAAYAGIDVAWVRVLWILATIFSGGFTLLLYIVMIFAVPLASTAEEIAAAHGAPFTAQHVVDRAKGEYAKFTESETWRSFSSGSQRMWRQTWSPQPPPEPAPPPAGYATRIAAGFGAFVFSIVSAALLIGFLAAAYSIWSTGDVFGWDVPREIPWWGAIVLIAIAYGALASPFGALRDASYATARGEPRPRGGFFGPLLIAALVLVVVWLIWPDARYVMEGGYHAIRHVVDIF